ncbi:DeoR/GlpR family DNA-binding transcription regulator [Streptomyces otsuchiensis]|uniref:DeoR/GlpR family DNA-binding transcription regulator n=1 Tax=Streptomyces otsuchiensis TaxID=2681388 RepID=UPI0010303666|nr:DeoR/GlpR family DNA-binding transcription regulator [Streptomyces otsuchiensis]
MSREARWEALLELLAARGELTVEEAAGALGVSAATVRRDLDALAERRMLRRTRGGAVAHGVSYELPLRYKAGRQADRKRRIARAVAELVAPGEAVGLTGGTTVTEVARALAADPRMSGGDGSGVPALTVVTNALNIAAELAVRPRFKTVVTGGVARPHSYELAGPLAAATLSGLTVDVAVLGVTAFDPEDGAWTYHEEEAAVNGLLCAQAGRVVVAADSGKLAGRSFARVCAVSAVDVLVTDDGVGPGTARLFEAAGVTIVTA